jgi:hypothetical protein
MENAMESHLDELFRLRLAQLPWEQFERFFLGYLNSGVSLSIRRNGRLLKRRVVSAAMYAPGSGRRQDGIDLRLELEGREVWAVQCKRVKTWSVSQTKKAIERAADFAANHNFLAVACDTSADVQEEISKHDRWTLWDLDTICKDFGRLVPPAKRRDVLPFLSPTELKRFLPYDTNALITPEKFFERYIGADKPLRHDWPLVGREEEIAEMGNWNASGKKVLVLTARGGEGKTRVVREFCARQVTADPGLEVLFLNPAREDDDFSLLLNTNATSRIIVVDDAHRAELVPLALLGLVQKEASTKIILASRPQGLDAVISLLINGGFGSLVTETMALPSFKKSEARNLAKAVLGDGFRKEVEEFLKLTNSNPFLITTAGGLLREDRIKWGGWGKDHNFRRHVFQVFETENLVFSGVPESEHAHARRLLRLLAILSPVPVDAAFVERAQKLIPGVVSVERLVQFLRLVELVVGAEGGMRVSPDLFADFLVYETCFAPENREPIWTAQVLDLFEDHTAALIRNFSEASWIAHLNRIEDDSVLDPLFKRQCEQFRKSSFLGRDRILEYWSTFSHYLPKLSLELAKLAIETTEAPPDELPMARVSNFDTHAYMLKRLPSMLRPVAKYHFDYSHQALDMLWDLGCRAGQRERHQQNHPWAVIAEVFKFELSKPIEYNLSALEWLETLLRRPKVILRLEGPAPVLRLFLEPCFARVVDSSYIEGRTIHFVEQHLYAPPTQPVRDRALSVLDGLIERGPVLAVLDVLSVLEVAVQRAGLAMKHRLENPEGYATLWRPERLKALDRYCKILEKYPEVVIRYEIRHTLKRAVIFEEDQVFAQECRQILSSIQDDLALRVAVAFTPDFAYEFEETFGEETPGRFEKSRERWAELIEGVAEEAVAVYPAGPDLYRFISTVVSDLTAGGYSLSLYPVLSAIGRKHSRLAIDLAHLILTGPRDSSLANGWPALIDNDQVNAETKFDLFEKAVEAQVEGARVAVIRHLSGEAQSATILNPRCQKLLLQIAAEPDELEARYLYQLITYCNDANLPWAFEVFKKLLEKPIDPALLGSCLTAVSPMQPRHVTAPPDLVALVFQRLIAIPDIGFFDHGHVWQELKKLYPLETYELLRARIAFSAGDHSLDYTAIPYGVEGRLRLPALAHVANVGAIVRDLWERVMAPETEDRWKWMALFQAVVFEDETFWKEELKRRLQDASTPEGILCLIEVISFEGSLIVFSCPEIAELFLTKARTVAGEEFFEKVRASLYIGSGPRSRGYTNGVLDKNYDYVEAAALKAAEEHSENPVLGPFFRWIVEAEQQDRLRHQMQSATQMADL